MNLRVEYDDLFVYAPSFLSWEDAVLGGELWEGKALGTAKETDLVLLDLDKTMQSFLDPEGFAKERKSGLTVGKRRLKKVQQRVEPELNKHINGYLGGGIDEKEFRQRMHKTMKVAWKEVFLAGVRSAGIQGTGTGGLPGKQLVQLTDPNDEKWIKGAMRHETQFLNGMIQAVIDETWVMPLPRRVRMYVDALESFYDSARVIGLPAAVKIHWMIGAKKKDRKTVCHSCRYLAHHSPYSKKTLPTVPRSGLTLCLTNCRDRLLVRMADQETAIALHQSSPTRGTHIKKLRKIKQQGHAHGILPENLLEGAGTCCSCGDPLESRAGLLEAV